MIMLTVTQESTTLIKEECIFLDKLYEIKVFQKDHKLNAFQKIWCIKQRSSQRKHDTR